MAALPGQEAKSTMAGTGTINLSVFNAAPQPA